MRLAINAQEDLAKTLVRELASELGDNLVNDLLSADQTDELGITAQRARVIALKQKLLVEPNARQALLLGVADSLVRRSVWIVGGDGWAYDIGFGGVDHVLASNVDVNILVLDTEVYSNTGGQASKATPRAAIAKFAASGKSVRRKDLGMIAVDYGHVYVAQIAIGANPLQTLKAFREAESYRGPSLIIAFSPCIAHGIDMSKSMTHQKDAVNSAFWPLFRFDPREASVGQHPFHLDSRKPSMSFREYAQTEARFAALERSNPEEAKHLFELAQKDINDQWHFYEQMAGIEREIPAVAST